MKRIALLMVLSAVICHAQSLTQSVDGLTIQVARMGRVMDIRNQIDDEFVQMTQELNALQDQRVTAICLKHINRIKKLSEKLKRQ